MAGRSRARLTTGSGSRDAALRAWMPWDMVIRCWHVASRHRRVRRSPLATLPRSREAGDAGLLQGMAQRRARVPAPCDLGSGARSDPRGPSHPSPRRRTAQQRPRESRLSHSCRAHCDALVGRAGSDSTRAHGRDQPTRQRLALVRGRSCVARRARQGHLGWQGARVGRLLHLWRVIQDPLPREVQILLAQLPGHGQTSERH